MEQLNGSEYNFNSLDDYIKSDVIIDYSDSWAKLELKYLLSLDYTMMIKDELTKTKDGWVDVIPLTWFYGIKRYSQVTLLKIIHQSKLYPITDTLKRQVTISSILFGFSVPRTLFLFDAVTFIELIKYDIVTELKSVNLDTIVFEKMPYYNQVDIDKISTMLLDNGYFNLNYGIVVDGRGAANIYNLHVDLIGFSVSSVSTELKKLSINQLKKVLTCMFLLVGLKIPSDYIYIDTDVYDWVKERIS